VDQASPLDLIVGKIAARGVREVDLLQDGRPISVVKASAHAPTLRIVTPRAHTRLGGSNGALVKWRSRDADHNSLTVSVRYSANGGRSWNTIFVGPDIGRVRLPGDLLSASRNARLRLYVSDGFNEAIATSPRFVSLGSPPTVSITSPSSRARLRAGGSLDLAGTAYDDTGHRLSGKRLVWRAGRSVVGYGSQVSTVALGAGRHRITLTGRDRHGRTGTASVVVTILPAPPVLTELKAPSRISPRARSLSLRLAAVAPARLTVGRVHVLITRRVRSVRVPVKRGHNSLSVVLVLRSGPYVTRVRVNVTR
jgi:hypothetical protein